MHFQFAVSEVPRGGRRGVEEEVRGGEGRAGGGAAEEEVAELGDEEAGIGIGGEAGLEGLEVVEMGRGGEEGGGGDAGGD